MVKRFEIWNSWIDTAEWETAIEEDREMNPGFYENRDPEEAAYEAACNMNQRHLDDERELLNIQLANPILIIADIGRWNGRAAGYKIISSGNIRDILQPQVSSSECCWYCDGYNIRCDESHHDGVNYYEYREIMDLQKVEWLLENTNLGGAKQKIRSYTRSLAKDVAKKYGFCKKEVLA